MRPASWQRKFRSGHRDRGKVWSALCRRSEEHTSELQSPCNLVCRLLLEKKKVFDFPEITKSEPENSLLEPLRRTAGRNTKRHITNRWQGVGHKRRSRRISLPSRKCSLPP